jgi:hypothetical protein
MRSAPVIFATAIILASLAPAAASAGSPKSPARTKAATVREVPLSQAGDWTVNPQISRRLVEISPDVFAAVKGKHERRHVRIARWIESLQGDPRTVFTREGMPVYRYRELVDSHLYEIWTYPERHLSYVFEGDRLTGTEPF